MDEERSTTYKVGLHLLVSERYGALSVRYCETTLLKYKAYLNGLWVLALNILLFKVCLTLNLSLNNLFRHDIIVKLKDQCFHLTLQTLCLGYFRL